LNPLIYLSAGLFASVFLPIVRLDFRGALGSGPIN
jgi:hypothetical protein